MGDKEWNPANVFDLFGDSLARRILVLATGDPVSVSDLAGRLDVSAPTVYRRTDALVEYDFLREHRQIDDQGNQYRVFETTVSRIEFGVGADGYDVDVERDRNLVDRFDAFWSEFERESPDRSADRPDHHDDVSPS